MQLVSCPWCNSSLPDAKSTEVCATCGKTLHPPTPTTPTTPTIAPLSEISERDPDVVVSSSYLGKEARPYKALFPFSYFSLLRKGFVLPRLLSYHRPRKLEAEPFGARMAFSGLTLDDLDEAPFTGSLQDPASEDNDLSLLRPDGQLTWQKVVEPSPHRPSYIYPPRPPTPDDEHMEGLPPPRTFVKHLSQSTSTLQALKRSAVSKMQRTSPGVLFWVSSAILLICISLFGLGSAMGVPTNVDNTPSLQITPNRLSIGATMTLSGDHFSPNASIGLTRDQTIPLTDTSGSAFTQADKTGHFTDTVVVDSGWVGGHHQISAEDPVKHQVGIFPVMVDRQGMTSGPPYLQLSLSTLDFGVGDPATNSTKRFTLSNKGNGEITWQATASEPWLLMTPVQGTFTSATPQLVTVAVDRSRLQPGSYTGKVHFSSNGGDGALSVSMQVVPLQPQHEGIMQISPTVLSFRAVDGSGTISQPITVSNSGGQPMNWQASADVPWLKVSPPSMTVISGGKVTAQVLADSRQLLPGTYTGTLTFTAQNSGGNGKVFHSPQQVIVTITITPPCVLVVRSAMLNFASAYLQPAPSPKTINLTASSGCMSPLNWSAKSNVGWLKLNNTQGTTPNALSVGIDVAGLTPNTYTGTVTFSSSAGTQIAVVTFRLGQALPLLGVAPSHINLNVTGTTSSTVKVTNDGGGALNWFATLQNGTPSFVSLSATSGSNLTGGGTASFNVVVNPDGVASGSYQTSVTINATNAANGQSVAGGPVTIPINIKVAAPLMQVSSTHLAFSGLTGSTISHQSLTITNGGGGKLSWTVSSPAPSWLLIDKAAGSTSKGNSSTLVFSIKTDGLAANAYTEQVVITPAVGSPVTIDVSLILTDPTPTPTPTIVITPVASAVPTPLPSPTSITHALLVLAKFATQL